MWLPSSQCTYKKYAVVANADTELVFKFSINHMNLKLYYLCKAIKHILRLQKFENCFSKNIGDFCT